MSDGRENRLSPEEAKERWGKKMIVKLPGGGTTYSSFDGDDGTWHPMFDEDMQLIGYHLVKLYATKRASLKRRP